jgi:serine/threonine protein kinase
MSEQVSNDGATAAAHLPPESQRACHAFQAALEAALCSGTPSPEVEPYLFGIDAAELPSLRAELDRIANCLHQRRLTPQDTDPHVDQPAGSGMSTNSPAGDATVPAAPVRDDLAATRVADQSAQLHTSINSGDNFGNAPLAGAEPQVVGYDILGVLGRGAMGVVYKARQRGLKRFVALKMILSGDYASSEELARFHIEAEAIATLQHPNIVQIYDIGDHDGKPFLSLEFVEGESLAKKISGNPLPSRDAAETVRAMAQAMQYAHSKSIIHRDLKPANVLVARDGQAKITDFGVAKRLDGDNSQTQHGIVLGTPSYMPPEQAEGRAADVGPLADVYSLGAILYELVTGRAPFRAATVLETLDQVRNKEPVSPSQLQPGTPRDLETICLKCLQKDPNKRYPSAGDLGEDLRRFLTNEPIRARPVSPWEQVVRWRRRNPLVAALGATVVLLTGLSLAGLAAGLLLIYNEKNLKEEEANRANNNAEKAVGNYELAMQNEKTAKEEAKRANDNAEKAIGNYELAMQNEKTAKSNAERALANESKAKKLADDTKEQYRLAVKQLVNTGEQMQKLVRRKSSNPQVESELRPIREATLQMLRTNLLVLAKNIEKTGITSTGQISSHQELGDSFRKLGLAEEALEQFKAAHQLAEQLVEKDPTQDIAKANLGILLLRLGDMERELKGDLPAARSNYQRGLGLQEEVEAHPHGTAYSAIDHKRLKAFYLMALGQVMLGKGDPAEARKLFDQAVAYRKDWVADEVAKAKAQKQSPDVRSTRARGYLAEAFLWRADAGSRLGNEADVADAANDAVPIIESLIKLYPVEKNPPAFDFQADLAESYLILGDAELRLGKYDHASQLYEKSLKPLMVAPNHDPDSRRYVELAVRAKYRLGEAARHSQDASASKQFEAALSHCENLVSIDSVTLPYQVLFALCLARTGRCVDAVAKADALQPRAAKDPELLLQIAGCYALCAESATDVAQKKALMGKALDVVRAAVEDGYKDRVNLETNPDLVPLTREPVFKEIVSHIKK